MDRHEAYQQVMEILAQYEELPFPELVSLVGQRRSERVRTDSGEEFLIDVRVIWANQEARRLKVIASADSPSTFRLQRLEERVFVSEGIA